MENGIHGTPPIKGIGRAQDTKPRNVPEVKKEVTVEEEFTDMEVDEEQFNDRKKRHGRVNRNLDKGIDEYEDDDSSEESDTSSESGQESTRRRAVVKRATENRKERQ